ncbi:MAG: DUF58 domain-containing protein [Zestosphaera sp.]
MSVTSTVKATERLTALLTLAGALIILWAFLNTNTLIPGLGLISLSLAMRLYTVASTNAVQKALVSASYEGFLSGEPVRVEFIVRNESRIPIMFFEFSLSHSPYVKATSGISGVTHIPPKGFARLSFIFEGRVGKYTVGPLKGVVRDPLGLYRSDELPVGRPIDIKILPKPSEAMLRRMFVASKVVALSRTRRVGTGVEMYGVREYKPGDELRRISWRHLSLWGKPFVKITDEEASLNLVFVIQLNDASFAGVYGYTPFEHISTVVASIAKYSVRRNDLMSLHVFSGSTHTYVHPARGYKAYQLITKALAEIPFNPELLSSAIPYTPREIINKVYQYLPRDRSIVLLLSTSSLLAMHASQFPDALSFISSKGHVPFILTPLTQAYEVKGLPEWGKALYRLKTFETLRNELSNIDKVKSTGVPVIAMGPENLVTEVVTRLEMMRS